MKSKTDVYTSTEKGIRFIIILNFIVNQQEEFN